MKFHNNDHNCLFHCPTFVLQEANDIAVSCMKSDAASADAVYVRGLCLYYKDNLDKGLTHFQQVLTLDPDHSKAKVMRLKAKSLKEKKENGKTNELFYELFCDRNSIMNSNLFALFC